MEIISGANNWKLVIRREAAGITILQAVTCDVRAALPEELFGLPVTALAHHALTPNRPAPAGEEVLVTCGIAREWDNANLEELRLPSTLKRAADYALFNCKKLKTLHLHDGLIYWGGAVLMNCRALDTFHITCNGREGEVLSCIADELPRELDVTLHRPDGIARLIFPEYDEVYEENVPHHQFDFHINGAGYPYHHCFYQRRFSLREYDDLWKDYLRKGHDEDCGMRLAWWRLRCPLELSGGAAEDYRAYLRPRAAECAHWLLTRRDAAGLRYLMELADPSPELLSDLCALARAWDATESLAVLLEEQHRRSGKGLEKTFDL